MDLDRRADDKTNANALILGNSGQGKTYLLRLLLCNVLEAGKSAISLDSEHEMEDLCRNLGGCFLDFMDGRHRINLLEPRRWDDGSEPDDPDAPPAFHGTLLAQHISFLRDIFRVYKDFDTPHIDTLELMVERLYRKWGINDKTDFSRMLPTDYPILSDLYDTIEDAYQNYEHEEDLKLYSAEMLRDLLLGLHSMCKGADARFFNGHTNISSARFLVFCVKGLDSVAQNLRDTLLFSVLSYMSDQLLSAGNAPGSAGAGDLPIPYTLKIRSGCENGGKGPLIQEDMTQAELVLFLETLAENIEAKATTAAEAAEIIREKIEALK